MSNNNSSKVRICEIKRHWGGQLVEPLQRNPKHVCRNCGEKADEEGNLCNPEAITTAPAAE